ncbi:NACHT domain-containing protein [Gordonia terrae]|uniref:NACHT domain-containing protein n=1 Tax=Gordonia terrae TaxID=2055 RepID=UPI00117F8C86|nr:hypothetical protein [Gordonia terrae]
MQHFPVGQPDGGRDALDRETQTVIQIKHMRTDSGQDTAAWLIEALNGELPKIRRLIDRGVQRYVMVTNARGSAHLGVGQIDRVQEWLAANVDVPATCLWRDDLDRRLDSASMGLKLKYCELLRLQDGLDLILGRLLAPATKDRQMPILRAFVSAQHRDEKTLKFKQVNLSNDLLKLFIDVPVGLSESVFAHGPDGEIRHSELAKYLISTYFLANSDGGNGRISVRRRTSDGSIGGPIGAAEFLMGPVAQEELRFVVIEGGPGQGKSTLAQYMCQVNRARFLGLADEMQRVDTRYRNTAFRLPIKVDLRDLAQFVAGKNPFPQAAEYAGARTVDAFLGYLISYKSGGAAFGADEVRELFGSMPVLVFLDGLDEVADLDTRSELVDQIGESIARWNANNNDIQVVITSRPSIFGESPNMEGVGCHRLILQDIDRPLVLSFAKRWSTASNLSEMESGEVQSILTEKLRHSHIRELTRNPMQLTILLSLIHQIGHSLPDQRTDLYSRYIDLFLAREAEKSAAVRRHRDILLDFVQYLAWRLQSQAESTSSSGRISEVDLKALARNYLFDTGNPVDIADDLFGLGLERVFVLVERVEGLFEFEVQSLREFFCARYLYSTAPVGTYHSDVLSGDRARRFEALVVNPFWLNVCRFYAGLYQKGEVASLVYSIKEILSVDEYARSLHTRRVGFALLSDWVFSKTKFIQTDLINAIFDGLNVVEFLRGDSFRAVPPSLDASCGRDVLQQLILDRILAAVGKFPDQIDGLSTMLSHNGGQELYSAMRERLEGERGARRTQLLSAMFRSGAAASITAEELWALVIADQPMRHELLKRCRIAVDSLPSVFPRSPELVDSTLEAVLWRTLPEGEANFTLFSSFASVMMDLSPDSFIFTPIFGIEAHPDANQSGMYERVSSFMEELKDIISGKSLRDVHFGMGFTPSMWVDIVEAADRRFGQSWATCVLALRGAALSVEPVDASVGLFDQSHPLVKRVRRARLRRGKAIWWRRQLGEAHTELDRMMWCGLVLLWASADNLSELLSDLGSVVDELSDDRYWALYNGVVSVASVTAPRTDRRRQGSLQLSGCSDRSAALVYEAHVGAGNRVSLDAKGTVGGDLLRTAVALAEEATELETLPKWTDTDTVLRWARAVAERRSVGRFIPRVVLRHLESRVPRPVRDEILANPSLYPQELVVNCLAMEMSSYRPEHLATVAQAESWAFDT